MKEIEARLAELREALDAPEADLDALEEEIRSLKAEQIELKEKAEKRSALLNEVAATATPVETFEEVKTEERKMNDIEMRNTREYIDAFAKYVRTNDAAECRALLSDAAGGDVPVPAFVLDIVAERVGASKILSRVRRANAKGVLKVGFEIAAPEADYHVEGGEEITEEALTLGIVTMNPGSFKKWVSFSDELMESSEAFLRYIYDEITRGITKAAEKAVIDAILAAPATATATAPAVADTGTAAGALDDFVNAIALLKDTEDLVVIVSPADYATYRGLQMAANYGVDPFDGREVIISDYATVPIVGNLYGVTVNMPAGEAVRFKLDDKTGMTLDLVRLLGRLPASVAVTSNLFFARVAEAEDVNS